MTRYPFLTNDDGEKLYFELKRLGNGRWEAGWYYDDSYKVFARADTPSTAILKALDELKPEEKKKHTYSE